MPSVRLKRPRKAIVLAAGYGTRMLPLSRDLPKPLMPLWGKPLLEHTLSMLRGWGVRDVLLNCHHAAEHVLAFAASQPVDGLAINLSFEPAILGTGGVLQKASWFLDDDPCWMVNGDIAADLSPNALIKAFAQRHTLASVWVDDARGPRTVEVKRGRIVNFSSRQPASPGTYTFCGLHLLSRKVLDYLPEEGFASIITAYEKAMKQGQVIRAICPRQAFWADMGKPAQYLAAHRDVRAAYKAKRRGGILYDANAGKTDREIKRHGVHVSGFAALSEGVRLKRGARLENVVAWDDATIEGAANVHDAIIARGATVKGCASYMILPHGDALDPIEQDAVQHMSRRYGALVNVNPLGARGSARAYTRIQWARRSAILVRYNRERRENALFMEHARFLRKLGLCVPRLLLDWPSHNLYVLEDVGDDALQTLVKGQTAKHVEALYARTLSQVAVLHARGADRARRKKLSLMPGFTKRLYAWERELFAEHYLQGTRSLARRQVDRIVEDLRTLQDTLLRQPKVLIHRDLQSSNIIMCKRKVYLIDFQGMRMGPAAYDLASLLCDPYVGLSERQQLELLKQYTQVSGIDVPPDVFWTAAIQRLAQALGAFGRLKRVPGAEHFTQYERPATLMMLRALKQVPGCRYLRRCMEHGRR